jgi:hypothetical protein
VLKKKLLLALVVLLPSYSYSDSITPYYGQTGNAAANGYTWGMGGILPDGTPGLDINGVIYNYTIQKEVGDSVNVHVQNENALGTGYIFRETDEWKPGSLGGTEINKVVPVVPGIPRQAWGDGSIEVEGPGSVEDANVIYQYKVNPCYDPQYDPNCPGYQVQIPDIPEVDLASIYDATEDENANREAIDSDLIEKEDTEKKSEEELAEEEAEEEKDRKERLEKALAAVDNSALFAQALAASQVLDSINAATNVNSYYVKSIPGGTYSDTIVLQDKQIPENKNGLRNGLAQQLLHEQMVDMQYGK